MTKISCEYFGTTSSGEKVNRYILDNGRVSVSAIEYGCAIQKIVVPDRDGQPVDVVLGYDTLEGYERGVCCFGALVGRYANRIKDAEYTLNGKRFTLTKNDGENHLHGVLTKRLFAGRVEGDTLVLTRECPDGEEGFPGNLHLEVRYALDDDNALSIEYRAVCDEDTPINLTNHSYFNLNGHTAPSVLDHTVWMDCPRFTENNAENIPTGNILDVAGTPMDFCTPKRLGADIGADYLPLKQAGGYDHSFIIGNGGELKKFAEVSSDATGVVMTAYTTQPAVQLFTPNFPNAQVAGIGKGGASYLGFCAFCLETQHYPSSVSFPDFPSTILRAGEEYREKTVYLFGIK